MMGKDPRERTAQVMGRRKYDDETLTVIYDRTNGYCHLCGKKLAFTNYGRRGAKGAWNVEHSIAVAMGGTHHLNNLFAACIACNAEKGLLSTRTARAANGMTRAPRSQVAQERARGKDAAKGAVVGGALGLLLQGTPGGAVLGALLGGALGGSGSKR